MNNNTFDKAKRTKSRKKWYIVRAFGYDNVYLWGVPFVPFILLSDKYKNWRYNRMVWSEEKATKMLNRILPKMLEWVEEDNAYYFCMEWGYSNYQYQVPRWHRAWVRKFASRLREYIKDGYENKAYVKSVEVGYETWVKFEERA